MAQTENKPVEDLDPLDRIGWLSECSVPLQRWVAEHGRWMLISAGKTLFREGDKTEGMYGVASGAVDIEFAPASLDSLTVVRVQPGGWLGQGSILPEMPRPFNLVAAIESKVLFVNRKSLRTLLTEQPDYWPEFYALALKQVLSMMTYLGESQLLTPDARLARQLLRLSVIGPMVEIRQSELVSLIGMSRSNVRRAVKSLVDSGIIETHYRGIEILDRRRLELASRRVK